MSIRGARTMAALAGAMALVGLVGCGGAARPTPSPPQPPAGPVLPRRPMELRLDGVDPCSLLTSDQKHQFNIASSNSVIRDSNSGPLRGSVCLWTTFTHHPDHHWTASTDLNQGVEFALGREPLYLVDGFAATTTTLTGSDPNYYCTVKVDVAPGQALDADYSNESRDVPGMNRKMACDNAMRLASAMLATLRTLKQR